MNKNLHFYFTIIVALFFAFSIDAQPNNDNCFESQNIGSSASIDFTTIDATTDGNAHPDNCASVGDTPDVIYFDVWYTYLADFTGTAAFSTCSTADFDTKIFVYAGGSSCPPTDADIIACNEDGPGCAGATSFAAFDVVEGESYLLRLGGWGDSEGGESGTGTFSIMEYIAPPGPDNDNCEDAIVLELGPMDSINVEFTNENAITDGPFHDVPQDCFEADEPTVYNDVWYSYTATFNGWMEWSNCGTSTFDSRLAVYGADQFCQPDPDSLVGCGDDNVDPNNVACGNFTSVATFPVTEGAHYLLRMGAWGSNGSGSGTFYLKRIPPPIPPANDDCGDFADVPIITPQQADDFLFVTEGFTSNASAEGFPNPSCENNGEVNDVWYRFNSGTNTELELRFNIISNNAEFVIDLFSDCGIVADTAVGFCLRTAEEANNFLIYNLDGFPGTPTTYLMRISTITTFFAPGEFFLQLVGDVVSDVETLALEDFQFYPNPAREKVNTHFKLGTKSNAQIEIINTLGQVIRKENYGLLGAGAQNLSIPINNLNSGVYYFRLLLDDGQVTRSFVKE